MSTETYLEWLRRQGFQIQKSPSSWWYNAGPSVFQAFPYHWLITPSEAELNTLMTGSRAIGLRYSTPITAAEGMVSYHVVLHNPYSLELLRPQARNGVKKGSNFFTVERIPFERLADEGWKLQQDTMSRQGRQTCMTAAQWKNLCLAASNLPDFEAWAAVCDGALGAAQITARVEDKIYVPYAASRSDCLNQHVNNVLFFKTSMSFLARPGVNGIFFGLHSLDAPPSVDEFKIRMSIIPMPVRQRVCFHPFVKPLVNHWSFALLQFLARKFPQSCTFTKAEGMLRFHLMGKQSIKNQEWPNFITDEKARLLETSGTL